MKPTHDLTVGVSARYGDIPPVYLPRIHCAQLTLAVFRVGGINMGALGVLVGGTILVTGGGLNAGYFVVETTPARHPEAMTPSTGSFRLAQSVIDVYLQQVSA